MTEIRTVITLRRKWDENSARIRLYEKQLAQARNDLGYVTVAILIFVALAVRLSVIGGATTPTSEHKPMATTNRTPAAIAITSLVS